ncbi:O-methyltransferase involved in polyketide biosynthesis [Nocardiopsis composta]|uniref:O-methyltransferase involved in polyketide biosynthesis n=2 Tax=Nocardiopsis composta TaxID=157465 RepID=A0A7W8QMH9_9ACTN|nr:O-methyltransferase involved in polyketide biosynthesis [Nocardiopsis composta]
MSMPEDRIDGAALDGVSATTLWTLRNRAVEALRRDSVITDPWAVRLFLRIGYDYDRFGPVSQSHALRALAVDHAARDYLREHPDATVVALGEGLQTGFWRLPGPKPPWVSVDLPPVMELRGRLLPDEPEITSLPVSALDRSWMDAVDPEHGVFISAEGLLMYLPEDEVLALLADCAERFPGGRLIFDSIPAWFRDRTLAGMRLSDRYTVPPMPFSLSVSQALALPERVPGVAAARDVLVPPGRGAWGNPWLRRLASAPPLRDRRPALTLLDFAR